MGGRPNLQYPFRSLSFDPERPVWGLQIVRSSVVDPETQRWANIDRTRSTIDVTQMGRMYIDVPEQKGLGLDAQIFVGGSVERDAGQRPGNL